MNGSELIAAALDPRRSVVVEACAGSGKTWLLVSRILRQLLDGAAPGEILAITYTRKAAREIEERLADWLRRLATDSDAAVRAFLGERAIAADELDAAVARARGLYERVLSARPALTVSTFHGWFARLVQGAPLTSDLAGFVLHEAGNGLRDEVWQLFAAACGRRRDAAADALAWLLEQVGAEGTRKLLYRLAERRAEWHAHAGDGAAGLARALADLREGLGVGEQPEAIDGLLADELFMRKLREYAGILRRSDIDRDLQAAQRLETALAAAHGEACFDLIAAALLTQEGALRKRDASRKAEQRFGAAAAARLIELHVWLGARVLTVRSALCEERAYALNVQALTAGAAWLAALERYKRERRLMDFADLEWHVARLLEDEAQAAFLQTRLDARYRHILLDEFQDTNPLQWRILLAWLAAYDASAGRPRVFVVGDPKQSIYRFRRAEPRIFEAAAAFLQADYGAALLAHDTTRRNAPALIEVINRVFGGLAEFPHFRPHRSLDEALPGRLELLPLCERPDAAPAAAHMRNPLVEPQQASEDGRRREEAALLVARLRQIVGRWAVIDPQSGQPRPARYGDVMLLTRRRGALPEFERALRAADMPYLSVGRGGLLHTLEAADLTALLRALAAAGDDLALAHALRTPLLGAGEADLLQLAARGETGWRRRLQACAAEEACSPALARAARLIEDWRTAADRLPVHDLLDRIYHEGDLVARYRAAVPAPMWPGVAANLEAFLALALQLDAGRYPSLPRFVDELTRLDAAGDEEAPDEGRIQAAEAGDRLRILTIHGAKGLEAPIVWLIDAHNTHAPAEAWSLLIDWPPDAARPAHVSVLGRKEERGQKRDALIEAEAQAAAREELNLLYVAMTRARQYFFASGIAGERAAARTSFWERIRTALEALGAADAYGAAPATAGERPAPVAPEPAAEMPTAPPAPPGRRRERAEPGMAYGTRLHAALDWLSADGEAERAPPGIAAADWPRLRAAARAILDAPALRAFFDPARHLRARNEVEFVLADGSVGRIDRLVEFQEDCWVLDYKSGRPDAALLKDYRAQMESYRGAVRALFPDKTVRCGLIFAAGDLMEI